MNLTEQTHFWRNKQKATLLICFDVTSNYLNFPKLLLRVVLNPCVLIRSFGTVLPKDCRGGTVPPPRRTREHVSIGLPRRIHFVGFFLPFFIFSIRFNCTHRGGEEAGGIRPQTRRCESDSVTVELSWGPFKTRCFKPMGSVSALRTA